MCIFIIAAQAPCNDHQFRCDNGQCIEISKRCDAVFNCVDFTDEFKCGMPHLKRLDH